MKSLEKIMNYLFFANSFNYSFITTTVHTNPVIINLYLHYLLLSEIPRSNVNLLYLVFSG
jgi:hypothetical protein